MFERLGQISKETNQTNTSARGPQHGTAEVGVSGIVGLRG
jgi:hypothetical protein